MRFYGDVYGYAELRIPKMKGPWGSSTKGSSIRVFKDAHPKGYWQLVSFPHSPSKPFVSGCRGCLYDGICLLQMM